MLLLGCRHVPRLARALAAEWGGRRVCALAVTPSPLVMAEAHLQGAATELGRELKATRPQLGPFCYPEIRAFRELYHTLFAQSSSTTLLVMEVHEQVLCFCSEVDKRVVFQNLWFSVKVQIVL